MSEVRLYRRDPHRVRQGRRPPHPPRRQGAGRHLRPRRRPAPRRAAAPRLRHRDPQGRHQRAADPRHRGRRAARDPEVDPAPPDQGLLRARRPAGRPPRREGHRRRPDHHHRRGRPRRPAQPGDHDHLSVEAEATHIPTGFEVSIDGPGDRHARSPPATSSCPTGSTLDHRPRRCSSSRSPRPRPPRTSRPRSPRRPRSSASSRTPRSPRPPRARPPRCLRRVEPPSAE